MRTTRITNLNRVSARNRTFASIYAALERQKNLEYEDRIVQIKKGNFTPFVMSSTGGLGPSANIFVQHITKRISAKRREPYSKIVCLLRDAFADCLARALFMNLRASRTVRSHGYALGTPS